MVKLKLSLLGPVEVLYKQRTLTAFRTKAVQALLIYLACQREQAHPREGLMLLLWPELPTKSAQANLRQALYHLRQMIPEVDGPDGGVVPFLLTDRKTIGVNPHGRLSLDITDFEAGISNERSPADLETAVALYRDDFLTDFYLPGSPNFENWALARRAQLRRRLLNGLARLADKQIKQGNLEQAERAARRQLEIDNLREEAHQQLMMILALNGRRTDALTHYQTMRQLLGDELGITPSAATEELVESIRDDSFVGKVIGDENKVREDTPRHVPHNLPPQATPFIGRQTELTELDQMIADPTTRLVTIVGPGGMGKTRLALAVAEIQLGENDARLPRFRDGVFFIPLEALDSVEQIPSAISTALDFRPLANDPDGRSPWQQTLDFLMNKQTLLVIDNFEQLLDGVDYILSITKTAPNVTILITSKEKLALRGERLFQLHGLHHPQKMVPGAALNELLDSYSAPRLFIQSARRLRSDFTLGPDEGADLVQICRLVGGMPLGLELASGWIEHLSLGDIVAEIKESLDILETDMRDVPERQRSITAVFEGSWQRLEEAEQTLLMQLSVFRGGFTRHASGEITGINLRQLAALSGKSFIQSSKEAGRYQIHRLLRQFLAERLAADNEAKLAVQDRHSAYYCALLKAREADWKSGKEVAAFGAIESDYENIRTAWNWAAERGQFDWLAQAMDSMGEAYSWHARYQEGEAAFAEANNKMGAWVVRLAKGFEQTLQIWAKALIWQAEFNREFLGRQKQAVQMLQKSQELLHRAENAGQDTRRIRALLLIQLSRVARDEGDQEQSGRQWDQSLALSQELGDLEWVTYKIGGSGWGAFRAGRFDDARNQFQKALSMWDEQGNTMYITAPLTGLGTVALAQGQLEESERLLRRALAINQKRGKAGNLVNQHSILGSVLLYRGKFDQAYEILVEGREIYSDSGRIVSMSNIDRALAKLELHSGQYQRARDIAQEMVSYWKTKNSSFFISHFLRILGQHYLVTGEYLEARRLLTKSADLLNNIGRKEELEKVLVFLGLVQQKLDQSADAQQLITESLQLLLKSRSFTLLVTLLPITAYVLACDGHISRALELYALSSNYPFVANSIWFEDIAGKEIAAAAKSLPPGAAEAARQRGRGLDPWQTVEDLLHELRGAPAN